MASGASKGSKGGKAGKGSKVGKAGSGCKWCEVGDCWTHQSVKAPRVACIHWQRGSCEKGDACTYLHDPEAKGSKPVPCRYFANGSCLLGDKCTFSHELDVKVQDASQLESTTEESLEALAESLGWNIEADGRIVPPPPRPWAAGVKVEIEEAVKQEPPPPRPVPSSKKKGCGKSKPGFNNAGKSKGFGEKKVHALLKREFNCPWCEKGECWDHKTVIGLENGSKRQRLEAPIWDELPAEYRYQLGEALYRTFVTAKPDDANVVPYTGDPDWNFQSMYASVQDFLKESTDDVQLLPSRKIHVGLMDYMGESHETYRKALDFLETSNTWYDTDTPNRRTVRWLPEECGWHDPSIYDELASRVDDGFSLVVKVSHVATHMCRLERPDSWWPELWTRKYSRVAKGAVAFLWQFAPKFRCGPESLRLLGDLFRYLESREEGATLRHIVDFRNASWYNEEVYSLLKEHKVCLAWLHLQNTGWAADLPSGWTPTIQTTDFTFIRLFGNEDRCTGWYDNEFLQQLYQMCPHSASSYVLFGNKGTKEDPEPAVPASFENAKQFRSIFSTVDFIAPIVSIKNKGRCPRELSVEDSSRVGRFFIRYSESARRAGVRAAMPVSLVESEKGERLFEWTMEVVGAVRFGVRDVGEQQDLMRFAKQISGMEDVEVVEAVCSEGERELSPAEAHLVNSTFIRHSYRARETGILITTPTKVISCDEGFVLQWSRTETAMTGVAFSTMNTVSEGPMAALSCGDLRAAVAEETDIFEHLCDLVTSLEEERHRPAVVTKDASKSEPDNAKSAKNPQGSSSSQRRMTLPVKAEKTGPGAKVEKTEKPVPGNQRRVPLPVKQEKITKQENVSTKKSAGNVSKQPPTHTPALLRVKAEVNEEGETTNEREVGLAAPLASPPQGEDSEALLKLDRKRPAEESVSELEKAMAPIPAPQIPLDFASVMASCKATLAQFSSLPKDS
eukprot:TRINITY_DN4948_c0_g1_i1.p1 TRINITY_DN4948_c0_g1~~TRINITY_DN4948_c0_g1_i1.p1  ORF type:complete len:960 (+),score=143.24 TRINITY_DN4948_c0_g1_i1:54-2933(+)